VVEIRGALGAYHQYMYGYDDSHLGYVIVVPVELPFVPPPFQARAQCHGNKQGDDRGGEDLGMPGVDGPGELPGPRKQ
jgi:hypothetical protein